MLRKIQTHLWRNGISPVTALAVLAMLAVAVFLPHTAHGLSILGTGIPLGAGMILDAQTTLSDFQALTATAASTNVLDFSKARSIGVGEPLALVITLDVAADATDGNETYTAQLQTDTTAAFGSPVAVGPVITITRGDAAGKKYTILLPNDASIKQFLRLNYTLGGTTPSVTLTAEIVPATDVQNADTIYASGFVISS
jgi:hypothetical protein